MNEIDPSIDSSITDQESSEESHPTDLRLEEEFPATYNLDEDKLEKFERAKRLFNKRGFLLSEIGNERGVEYILELEKENEQLKNPQ